MVRFLSGLSPAGQNGRSRQSLQLTHSLPLPDELLWNSVDPFQLPLAWKDVMLPRYGKTQGHFPIATWISVEIEEKFQEVTVLRTMPWLTA
ncbi:hypothetical protein TIFTF001_018060 [Ficus carica]|uniref:Uncharacterized protein n=1 Tax=Ficus carica TaxID=3494 RepID=A0AA88AV53_FICCA|nr:hypothetical protein TIFTF001_018060 [Ficus carica]